MVEQSAIDALLARARAVLDRVEPGRLDEELAAGAVLIDIRPVEQRQRDGELPARSSSTATSLSGASIRLRLIVYRLRHAPIFASSWCAIRATAQASPRPHCVILV